MKDTSWDYALEVNADGNGLVGHAGGILLRKQDRRDPHDDVTAWRE
jgi:hypothetical protein